MAKRKPEKRYEFKCAGCKRIVLLRASDLRNKTTDYCKGCSNRVRAGLSPSLEKSEKGTRLHNIWCGMRQRCGHKNGGHDRDIKHYASRGIVVCEEWRRSFYIFKKWALNHGYDPILIIDRKNNNEGYSPDNCRWVTMTESQRNKRTVLTYEQVAAIREKAKEGISQTQLASEYERCISTISNIVNNKTWL